MHCPCCNAPISTSDSGTCRQCGAQVQSTAATDETTNYVAGSQAGSSLNAPAARLNCPHCNSLVAIVGSADAPQSCESCGGLFQLDGNTTKTWENRPLGKISRFQLLRELGRGAFGTVYLAQDTQLERTVALKVPRAGTFQSEQEEGRFLREARSAARLSHAGIVPVYEVEQSAGRSYIVSEYIEGVTLADAMTGRRFTFREAAQLVACLAEALEHAHQRQVIHRDLKPANVMLDVSGQPRLMDFGMAKRDAAEVTMTLDGHILGTPAYMSPEQARGDSHLADARSDIYSLGVILFELLTAERPFRGNSRMLLHQVLHAEPPHPRQLNHSIPRDLETITLKCLEKDSARRYASAQALASDLQCWLRNEPIAARPISKAERAWRWMQRNPVPVRAAAAIFAILALSLTVVGVFYGRERLARKTAEELAIKEERAKQEALARFVEAREAVDLSLTAFSESLRYYPGAQQARLAVLEKAAENYERFANQTSAVLDEEFAIERARTHVRLGNVHRELGRVASAVASFETGAKQYAAIAAAHEGQGANRWLVAAADARIAKALALAEESANLQQAEQELIAQATALEALATEPKLLRDDALATARFNLARLADQRGDAPSAIRYADAAWNLLKLHNSEFATNFRIGILTVNNHQLRARLALHERRISDARADVNAAMSLLRRLIDADPNNPSLVDHLASACLLEAAICRSAGDAAGERAAYQQALAELDLLVTAVPDVLSFRENLALTRTDLGQLLQAEGLALEATAELLAASKAFEDLRRQWPEVERLEGEQATCQAALACALADAGEHERAQAAFTTALATFDRLAVPLMPAYRERYCVYQSFAGQLAHKLGADTATSSFETAQQHLANLISAAPDNATLTNTQAFVNWHQGRLLAEGQDPQRAEKLLEQARSIWRKQAAAGDQEALYNLAWSYVDRYSQEAAPPTAVLSECAPLAAEPVNVRHVGMLGCLLVRGGDSERGLELLERAERVRAAPCGRELVFRALAQWQLSKPDAARQSLAAARAWMAAHQPAGFELQRLVKEASVAVVAAETKE